MVEEHITKLQTFTSLFVAWLIYSCDFSAYNLLLGLILCTATLKIFGENILPHQYSTLTTLRNVMCLIKDVVISSLTVLKIILKMMFCKYKIQPKYKYFTTSKDNDKIYEHTMEHINLHDMPLGPIFYANAITLTPGTISVDFNDSNHDTTVLVHVLD